MLTSVVRLTSVVSISDTANPVCSDLQEKSVVAPTAWNAPKNASHTPYDIADSGSAKDA